MMAPSDPETCPNNSRHRHQYFCDVHGQPTHALVDASSYAERYAKGLTNRAQQMRQCDLLRQNTVATGSALVGLWPPVVEYHTYIAHGSEHAQAKLCRHLGFP